MCANMNNSNLQALCHTREIMAEISNKHEFYLYKGVQIDVRYFLLTTSSAFFPATKNKISSWCVDCPDCTNAFCESCRV
jgi:hypothetical protein